MRIKLILLLFLFQYGNVGCNAITPYTTSERYEQLAYPIGDIQYRFHSCLRFRKHNPLLPGEIIALNT